MKALEASLSSIIDVALDRDDIELYMNLEGKATLKVEEVAMNAEGTSDYTGMWDALDHAFLPIDHHESRYR